MPGSVDTGNSCTESPGQRTVSVDIEAKSPLYLVMMIESELVQNAGPGVVTVSSNLVVSLAVNTTLDATESSR